MGDVRTPATSAEAVAYVESLLTRARAPAPGDERAKLRRTEELLRRLGSPHRAFPSVLIAGTKGKGSTAAMMASVLQAAGFRVGLYTKPHLVDYRERVRVNGVLIAPDELVAAVGALVPHVEAMAETPDGPPSYFDASVAVAFGPSRGTRWIWRSWRWGWAGASTPRTSPSRSSR